MLVDPHFVKNHPLTGLLSMMAGQGPIMPERHSRGVYMAGHWNVEDMVAGGTRDDPLYLSLPTHGVCDTPEQALERLKLDERDGNYFVSFVMIEREKQDANGGWRYHKWGEYIGEQEPKAEYIYDDHHIDRVYTFTVHEMPKGWTQTYTAELLIELCEAAIVPHHEWDDRDTAGAQRKVGTLWALLKAGCVYEVKHEGNVKAGDLCTTDDKTIWIEVTYDGFGSFDSGDDQDNDTFYLPTWTRLRASAGGDWY